jgi:hypothetical protein
MRTKAAAGQAETRRTFDLVFDSDASQQELFDAAVAPVVDQVSVCMRELSLMLRGARGC